MHSYVSIESKLQECIGSWSPSYVVSVISSKTFSTNQQRSQCYDWASGGISLKVAGLQTKIDARKHKRGPWLPKSLPRFKGDGTSEEIPVGWSGRIYTWSFELPVMNIICGVEHEASHAVPQLKILHETTPTECASDVSYPNHCRSCIIDYFPKIIPPCLVIQAPDIPNQKTSLVSGRWVGGTCIKILK